MKYPLKWRHNFLRETACFLFGHQWKTSWRPKANFDELHESELSYSDRKSGNPYWEFGAWWTHKCVRCRVKIHGDAHEVWHRKQYWAIRDALSTSWFHLKYNFKREYYNLNPFSFKVICLEFCSPLLAILCGAKQYLLHFDTLPWSWWTWMADLEYWWYCKLDN